MWTSAAYNAGDSVIDAGEFHIANSSVTGGTVDGPSWRKLTTNMDYLGPPTAGDTFRNGEIIFDTGHYHLRIGGRGSLLPAAAPAEWVTLSAGAESDAACQVKQYPTQVNNSNRLATVTAGSTPDTSDTPVWEITYSPQAVGSRVSIVMSMNIRAEDDGNTAEEVRYTYALFHDSDSFNQIGGVKQGALRVGDSAGVLVWDHQLAEHFSHQPNTTDEVTYSFRLQRRQEFGSGTDDTAEITFASWSATVLDWGDPNQSCNTVFQSMPIWHDGIEVVANPVRVNFAGDGVEVAAQGQIANVTIAGGLVDSDVEDWAKVGDAAVIPVGKARQAIYDTVAVSGGLNRLESGGQLHLGVAWETVEDRVDGLLVGGTNVTLVYDDAAGSLTIERGGRRGRHQRRGRGGRGGGGAERRLEDHHRIRRPER